LADRSIPGYKQIRDTFPSLPLNPGNMNKVRKYFARIVFYTTSVLFCSVCFAQSDNLDSMFIGREKAKWEALKTGNFGLHNEWFTDDFSSIGYMPDGSVYRMEKSNLAKPTNPGEKGKLPAADFLLSNFKVINASETVRLVTYQADGPINLYVTSVWSKRGNEWKTVFYQATKYK
jgi:hypothetical protein